MPPRSFGVFAMTLKPAARALRAPFACFACFACFAFCAFSFASASAQEAPAAAPPPAAAGFRGTGVYVELVAEVAAIRPGHPFSAGFFIRHDTGWHTYWKNPGLAGVAPALDWRLPEGWKAGEIEWPAPDVVNMATIDTHGYEHDVLLMVTLTPPPRIAEKEVELKLKASWMSCTQACTPGWADLSLKLPVAAPGDPPSWSRFWRRVFERERLFLPVPLAGWRLEAVRRDKTIVLTGEPETPGPALPEAPRFFSGDGLICSHAPQKWAAAGKGFRAELTVSDYAPPDQTVLRGLLRGTPGWLPGDPRAVVVEVPVR